MSSMGEPLIYVLGVGNLGKFVAHSIKSSSPATPVILLFHRANLFQEWDRAGKAIRCVSIDGKDESTSEFNIELACSGHEASKAPEALPIKHLIVATKSYATASAVGLVKHRLGKSSHILFLQNGMGALDEVSARHFPNSNSRPTYWAGICSFGVYTAAGPFSIVHAGRGSLVLGRVLNSNTAASDDVDVGGGNELATTVLDATALEGKLVTPKELRAAQLQKLTVNAIINPLTAVLGSQNGGLLESDVRVKLVEMLVRETSPVIRSLMAGNDGNPPKGFSDAELMDLVCSVASNTRKNTSSMLQDVRAKRRTEIDYINGYVAAMGEKAGIPCPHNKVLVEMVKEGKTIDDEAIMDVFKFR